MPNSCVNILHLTDLHLRTGDDFDQKLVLAAALRDIAALRGSALCPDLILFSGDVVQAADETNAYSKALDLLMRIADSVGLTEEQVLICPGNHDISRRVVGPSLLSVQEWSSFGQTRDGANMLQKNSEYSAHVFRSFSDFHALAGIFGAAAQVATGLGYSTYFFRELGLSIVTLNTATLSTAGLIQGVQDDRKLFVAESTLIEAFASLPAKSHVVVVGHHPAAWLNMESEKVVRDLLSRSAGAYLSGHLHEVDPISVSSLAGSCFFGQSGALYEWRDHWCGYAVYQMALGTSHVKTTYRRWYDRRREFSKAEELAPEGVAYSTPEAHNYFRTAHTALDWNKLAEWRTTTLLDHLQDECNKSLSPVPISDTFVPPEFERDFLQKDEISSFGPKVERVTFEKAQAQSINLVISAPGQSGKTTALRQWALELARSGEGRSASVPVLLSADGLRDYLAYMESKVAQQLPQLPAGMSARRLLSHGAVTIFIDDVEFKQSRRFMAIAEFMKEYPLCRYIVTTASAIVDSTAFEPVIAPQIPFTHVRLRPLRRRQLLSLIHGHGITNATQADQLLERVTREANSLSVPMTAVTGSLLIQVFSSEPDRVLVNQATLVERYIELLLQKFSRPDVELKSFDFKLKRDLLSKIAEKMIRDENYRPEYNTVLGWILDYVKLYGFAQPATQILEHFIACRVMDRVQEGDETKLTFTLKAFGAYFAAYRMIEDTEFRGWIMDSERYLSFMNETSFYTALVRNDKAVLDEVFGSLDALSEQMWSDASEEVRSGAFMDEFSEANPEATEEEVFAIQEIVRSNSETDAERDRLQEDVAGPLVRSQKVNRPDFKSVGERWFAHLQLASMVLKHSELIPDAEKRLLLDRAITSWLQFCTFSLSLVPQLARDKVVTMNGVQYKLLMQSDVPLGELVRRISLVMPLAVSQVATPLIGSEKLRLQLEDGIGKSSESASRQLMRALLLADIGVDGIGGILRKAEGGIRSHRYLVSVLVRKLYDVAIRFRINDQDLEEVRNLASEVAVRLGGVKDKRLELAQKNIVKKVLRDKRIVAELERGAIGNL